MINYVNSHHFKPNKGFKTVFMHLVSWRIFFPHLPTEESTLRIKVTTFHHIKIVYHLGVCRYTCIIQVNICRECFNRGGIFCILHKCWFLFLMPVKDVAFSYWKEFLSSQVLQTEYMWKLEYTVKITFKCWL